jgi:hypothetical protein
VSIRLSAQFRPGLSGAQFTLVPVTSVLRVQHHLGMEVVGIIAVLVVVAVLVLARSGSSTKKDPPQAIQPQKPAGPINAPNKLVVRRPLKAPKPAAGTGPTLDYGSTTGPVTDDTGVPDYGSNADYSFMRAGAIRRAHEAAGPVEYIPPPPIPGRQHKVVDVPGTFTRLAVGGEFDHVVERLPMGPVYVTLRLEANEVNRYGLVAYVDGCQVGWMTTKEWAASDTWVRFMTRLDEAGILPRFQGLHRIEKRGQGDDHMIHFDVPGRDEGRIGDIARRIIKEQNGPPPK